MQQCEKFERARSCSVCLSCASPKRMKSGEKEPRSLLGHESRREPFLLGVLLEVGRRPLALDLLDHASGVADSDGKGRDALCESEGWSARSRR